MPLPLTPEERKEYNNVPTTPKSNPLGEALSQLYAGIGGGGGTNFIFRPGGTAGGNVYTDWATLHAAIGNDIGRVFIIIDSSLAPAIVPAGAYTFGSGNIVEFWGSRLTTGGFADLITFADGATIANVSRFTNALRVESLSSSPVFTSGIAAAGGSVFFIDNTAEVESNGLAAFFDVPLNGFMIFLMNNGSRLTTGTNASVSASDLTSQAVFFVLDGAEIEDDVLEGPGNFVVQYSSSGIAGTTQTGVTGTLGILALSTAVRTGYTPSVPGNWAPPPAEVGEALDQLAAAPGGVQTYYETANWTTKTALEATLPPNTLIFQNDINSLANWNGGFSDPIVATALIAQNNAAENAVEALVATLDAGKLLWRTDTNQLKALNGTTLQFDTLPGNDNLGDHIATQTLVMGPNAIEVEENQVYQHNADPNHTNIIIEDSAQQMGLSQAGNIHTFIDADNDTASAFFVVSADGNFTQGAPVEMFKVYENGHAGVRRTMQIGNPGMADINSSSATLEVDANPGVTSGIRVPRMTTIERDAAGASDGIIIFNTTTGTFQGFNGTVWANL